MVVKFHNNFRYYVVVAQNLTPICFMVGANYILPRLLTKVIFKQ